MSEATQALYLAVKLVTSMDAGLVEIVLLSLKVSLLAVAVACAIGLPLGALLAISRFRGRRLLISVNNALMGLPPVVVGLAVYLMLSRSGPFGVFGLLYTPTAMIIAQTLLVLPIVAALSRQTIEDLNAEYDEYLRSLDMGLIGRLKTLLWDGRASLATAAIAGLGRAIAEVGAVIIVGGNIDHVTRVMTTAIALETSKGDLALALALGLVLVTIALALNAAVEILRAGAERKLHAGA
ncbi:MAG: ABC transporter permease [Hyphomicrobiales bacterium]|nr:ABC transporter permease [Hyphomicrobiales bacterium]